MIMIADALLNDWFGQQEYSIEGDRFATTDQAEGLFCVWGEKIVAGYRSGVT
jgi:hypothetical protein